jgi:hypothetical protein
VPSDTSENFGSSFSSSLKVKREEAAWSSCYSVVSLFLNFKAFNLGGHEASASQGLSQMGGEVCGAFC